MSEATFPFADLYPIAYYRPTEDPILLSDGGLFMSDENVRRMSKIQKDKKRRMEAYVSYVFSRVTK